MSNLRNAIRNELISMIEPQILTTFGRICHLEEALFYFERLEQYEKCALYRDCIRKLKQIQKGKFTEDTLYNASYLYSVLSNEYLEELIENTIQKQIIDSFNGLSD